MIINVTQAHIDMALAYANIRQAYSRETDLRTPKEVWSSFSCPIALAATEARGIRAQVDGLQISFENTKDYMLPDEARAFVTHFDFDKTVEPFSFELVMNGD